MLWSFGVSLLPVGKCRECKMSVSWKCKPKKGVCCEDTSCCPEDFSCLPDPGGCGLAKQNNTDNVVSPCQFSITSADPSLDLLVSIHQGLEWLPRIPLVKSSLAPIVDAAGDCGSDHILCTSQVSKPQRMLVQLFSGWYQSQYESSRNRMGTTSVVMREALAAIIWKCISAAR